MCHDKTIDVRGRANSMFIVVTPTICITCSNFHETTTWFVFGKFYDLQKLLPFFYGPFNGKNIAVVKPSA